MRVRRLSVTPIKGLGLHHPDAVYLDASGARGDRDFCLADERGKLLSITRSGALLGLRAAVEDGHLSVYDDRDRWEDEIHLGDPITVDLFGHRDIAGRIVEGPWAAVLSERIGQPVRLVKTDAPGDGSDINPVTILGSASVDDLAKVAGEPVDPRRFRMLIDLETDVPYVEDTWEGRTLTGEHVELAVRGPVPRCAATTRHPERGDRDLPVVKLLLDHRGQVETEIGPGVGFGVYARVTQPGPLRVGETLT